MAKQPKTGKPCLPNVQPYIAAGINPKTGLPIKFDDLESKLKANIKSLIKIVDRQDACNRYVWYNLPSGLTGQDIERILYYKGQAILFYMDTNETFYFLPYALAGSIDVYGRYTMVTPVPLANAKDEEGKDKPWIVGLTRKPQYDVLEEVTLEDFKNSCVILRDYQHGISQTITPREIINDGLIDAEAECIPFMNTGLQNSTGVTGMRIPDDDAVASVMAANNSTKLAALNGQRYIPITGTLEFQELAGGSVLTSSEYMQAMESLDNFRLSLYGLKNGGLFQKKAHMLEDEQALANGDVALVMEDGLKIRQDFCNIVNSIWPLGIWCEVAEPVVGIDKNMDGEISDEEDNQQPIDMQVGGSEDVTE